MGQSHEEEGYLFGRIGFQAAGVTELWNEETNDFEEAQLPAGTTAPFLLDLGSGGLAFQRRPGLIRPTSFTGAFQALLNAASDFAQWRVHQETRKVEWRDWVGSVDRVIELRFRLVRPNPDYEGRPDVERIIEGANAQLAGLVLKTGDDDIEGLDIDDALIAQAIDHASRYGTYSALGEREGEEPVKWTSDQEVVPERTIDADPATREARAEGLRRELTEHVPDPDDEGGTD